LGSIRKQNSLLCLLLILVFTTPAALRAQTATTFSQARKLFVDSFGQDKGAAEMRAQFIRRLADGHEVSVTSDRNEADAVVKGTARIWTTGHISASTRSRGESEATYSGFLSVEVIGRNGQTLWSYLVTPSKFPFGSITDDLSSQLAARLLRDRRVKTRKEPVAPGPSASTRAELNGAGATFPAPLYQKWFQSFEDLHPDMSIHYDAVGSAEGIDRLEKGAVDFGASDMPLPDEAMSRTAHRFVHIPMALGAVVPIYNVQLSSGEIRFTPEILAGIYLGKIKKWNDPQVRSANRGANLPDAEIAVVHRSDGSGTTFVWTDYLSKVSPEWKSSVGSGLTLKWPVGAGAAYNEGVASAVQQTPNSIGYVEFIYAIQHELAFARVKNPYGRFIHADLAGVTAAIQSAKSSGTDLRVSITNSPVPAAYPIASYTYLLLPDEIPNENKRSALLDLLRWVLTSGQKSCSALGYAPLPSDTVKRGLEALDSIK